LRRDNMRGVGFKNLALFLCLRLEVLDHNVERLNISWHRRPGYSQGSRMKNPTASQTSAHSAER
jgi:hypothetical protein